MGSPQLNHKASGVLTTAGTSWILHPRHNTYLCVMWTSQRFKFYRTSRGLTQKAIAELVGIDQQLVSEWERLRPPGKAYQKILTKLFGRAPEVPSGQEG